MFAVRRAILSALLLALVGCPLDRDQPPPVAVIEGKPRVLVLALKLGSTISPDGRFVPRRDPASMPPDVSETAAARLAAALGDAGVPLVDGSKMGATAPADIGAATRTASQAGANVALVGALSRYDERDGNAWSVRSPASVAYDLVLVRARDGKTIGENHFDYTQQPLTSNLLEAPRFVQAGARWMTRAEMLDGALGESAASLAAIIRGEKQTPVLFLGR